MDLINGHSLHLNYKEELENNVEKGTNYIHKMAQPFESSNQENSMGIR